MSSLHVSALSLHSGCSPGFVTRAQHTHTGAPSCTSTSVQSEVGDATCIGRTPVNVSAFVHWRLPRVLSPHRRDSGGASLPPPDTSQGEGGEGLFNLMLDPVPTPVSLTAGSVSWCSLCPHCSSTRSFTNCSRFTPGASHHGAVSKSRGSASVSASILGRAHTAHNPVGHGKSGVIRGESGEVTQHRATCAKIQIQHELHRLPGTGHPFHTGCVTRHSHP